MSRSDGDGRELSPDFLAGLEGIGWEGDLDEMRTSWEHDAAPPDLRAGPLL